MTVSRVDTAKKFLARELERLNEQEREIVNRFIHRKGVARNVESEFAQQLSLGERVADRFATVMGSWPFIIIQSITLAIWVALNLTAYLNHWDPYPFILLNLALSFQAAYAAPIIMMSQNRQADKDRLQSKSDYEVNLKAEMEIMQLHEKFNELRDHYWADLLRMQQQQIDMLERLVNELCKREPTPAIDGRHNAEGKMMDL
jgi:uncharacterized membrane protein